MRFRNVNYAFHQGWIERFWLLNTLSRSTQLDPLLETFPSKDSVDIFGFRVDKTWIMAINTLIQLLTRSHWISTGPKSLGDLASVFLASHSRETIWRFRAKETTIFGNVQFGLELAPFTILIQWWAKPKIGDMNVCLATTSMELLWCFDFLTVW